MIYLPHIHTPPFGTKLNRKHPLAQHLTGYWLFNEHGGRTAFDALGQNHGTLTTSVDWKNYGTEFNETGDYVNCGNAGKFLKKQGTIFFQYVRTVVSDPVSLGGYWYWCVIDDDSSEFAILGAGAIVINSNGDELNFGENIYQIVDGVVHNMAFVWDADTNTSAFYQDGQLIGDSSTAFTWDAAGIDDHDFLIGGRLTGADRYAGGEINNFGIMDRALTPAEIISLHSQPYQMLESMFLPSVILSDAVPLPNFYMTLDEQSTYIDVHCDGYTARIYNTATEDLIRFYIGSSDYIRFLSRIVAGSVTYYATRYATSVLTIIENTPTRVVLQLDSQFYNSSVTALPYSVGISFTWVFYPDRCAVHVTWETETTTISMNDSTNNGIFALLTGSGITLDTIAESSGSEIDAADSSTYTTSDYLGATSTEVDIIGVTMDESHEGDAVHKVFTRGDQTSAHWGWNNGDIDPGTHTMSVMCIIDSTARQHGSKLYTSTERLQQGVQYTNPRAVEEYNPDVLCYVSGDQTTGQAVDIGTGNVTISGGTAKVADIDGNASGAFEINADDEIVSISSTDNITIDKGSVSFWFRGTGTPHTYGKLVTIGEDTDIQLYRKINDDDLDFQINSVSADFSTGIDNWDGIWRHYTIAWDTSINYRRLTIGDEYDSTSSTAFTDPTPLGTSNIYFLNRSDGLRYAAGEICNIYITNNPNSTNLYKPEIGEWIPDNAIAKYEGAGFSKDGAYHVEPGAIVLYNSYESGTASSSDLIIDVPANTVDGDLLVLTLNNDSGNSYSTAVEALGWTEILYNGSYASADMGLWYRVADSEPASYNFGSDQQISGVIALVKADTNGTWSVNDSGFSAPDTSLTVSDIAATAGGILFLAWGCDDPQSVSVEPVDMTHIITVEPNSSRSALWYQENISTLDYSKSVTLNGGDNCIMFVAISFVPDGEIKFSLGQIEHKPNIVIHDFPYTSGDGGVDYWLTHLDGKSLSTLAKSDATDGSTITNSGGELVDGGIAFESVADYCYITASDGNNIDYDKGTIIWKYKSTSAFDDYCRFFEAGSTNAEFSLFCGGDTEWDFRFAGTSYTLQSSGGNPMDIDVFDGNIHTMQLTWDNTKALALLHVDGVWANTGAATYNAINSDTPEPVSNNNLYIGGRAAGTNACMGIIYSFKILSEPIFPYGAYFTGNTTAQLTAGMYHKDILFYWDGSDCTSTDVTIGGVQGTKTGNGTFVASGGIGDSAYYDNVDNAGYLSFPITNQDIVDFTNCTIGFFLNVPAFNSGRRYISLVADSSNYLQISEDGDGTISIAWERGGTSNVGSSSGSTLVIGRWHFIRFKIESAKLTIYQDDVEIYVDDTISGTWTGTSGYLNIAADNSGGWKADAWYDQVFITNNPNTPQIPTANGVPLDVPIIKQ